MVVTLVVPPRHEVHKGEDDGHRHREEQDGSHRLLPPLLRRRATSVPLRLLPWFIGERVVALEVGLHEDVKQLGAGSGVFWGSKPTLRLR